MLAFVGSIELAHAQLDDRFPVDLAASSARDVVRAVRCAPPKACRARPAPRRADPALVQLAAAIASDEGVPVRLALALVRVESGFNPRARNGGALGLTQIKCATARGLGFAGSCAALLEPATNLRWGLRHAARALARGSIGFHQTGLGARQVTRSYVAKIRAAMN